MDGHKWKVTGIVTMPGVEPVCRPFSIIGLGSANSPFNKGLVMAGRLVLQPVGEAPSGNGRAARLCERPLNLRISTSL